MNGKSFPFEFDHAMGFFDKFLADAAGIAYLDSPCSTIKYSLSIERGTFNNLAVSIVKSLKKNFFNTVLF